MFDVQFFRANKLVNSTKQYSLSEASLTLRCELNSACSIVNPVLLINTSAVDVSKANVWVYNYCYIGIWGRFYHITDWVWSDGLWCAQCKEDVLASFRNDILNSTLYVMRSSFDRDGNLLYNGAIGDSKYPTTADSPTFLANAYENPYAYVEGVYIAGVINNESNNGAVTYYAFNRVGFRQFCAALYNYSSGWLNIDVTEISENLQKALVNPFQYVVSCMYLPINVQQIIDLSGEATTDIKFGWWSVRVSAGARIVNTTMATRQTISIPIPRHPSAPSRGAYLNLSPYSIYTLRFYPFGTINIDSEAIAGWNTLDLYADLDLCTGKGILNICVNGFNNPFRTIECQVGVQIPTASLQTNYSSLVTGKQSVVAAGAEAVGAISKVQSKRPDPSEYSGFKGFLGYVRDSLKGVVSDVKESVEQSGGITQVASDILNTAIAATTTAEIQGMQGAAGLFLPQTLTLSGRFLPVASEDLGHTGRPLMQLRQLSTVRGFTVCKDGDVICNANDREKQTIKAYLEGGVFIE